MLVLHRATALISFLYFHSCFLLPKLYSLKAQWDVAGKALRHCVHLLFNKMAVDQITMTIWKFRARDVTFSSCMHILGFDTFAERASC